MLVEDTAIESVKIITPKKFGDERGFFSETYNRSAWEEAGLRYNFLQDNHSLSAAVGVLRGLHFQPPPSRRTSLCASCEDAYSTSPSICAAPRRRMASM